MGLPYPDVNPYLKGLHLTMDGWRNNRNKEGWKIQSEKEWELLVGEVNKVGDEENWKQWLKNRKSQDYYDHPAKIKPASRLFQDL